MTTATSAPLTIVGARHDGATVGLRAEDGTIVALGPDVVPAPGDTVLDARGLTLSPPLVNGHTHAAMTLFRGFGGDLPLMRWLEEAIWPAEWAMTAADVYWGTRLAALEMLRSGTTHFWDMYWHQGEVARAVVDSGLRATVSQVILEADGVPDDAKPEHAEEGIAELGAFGPRVTPSLGPHAIYTVSDRSLELVAALSAHYDTPIQIHVSETEHEVQECLAAHGETPVRYLDRLGLITHRAVLAHCVWVDDDELALIAERGATIVTNPVSNMKLAVGRAFPYPAARAAGAAIGLGTDGAASNDSLDLLQDVKVLALLQRHTAVDAAVLPAAEAWDVVTGSRSPLLGGAPLAVGRPADVLLLDLDAPEVTPAPLPASLVYAATGAVVDTAVVAGRVLMERRVVEDEEEIRAHAREAYARLTGGGRG